MIENDFLGFLNQIVATFPNRTEEATGGERERETCQRARTGERKQWVSAKNHTQNGSGKTRAVR